MAEEDTPEVPGPNHRPLVLPDRYSGKEEWSQWISHFDNVAAVNTWNEAQKLLWLKVRLTERAQTAFQHFPDDVQKNYEAAKKALKNRFEPECRKDRYQAEFSSRRRKKTEGWADFSEDLKILADKAYPHLEAASIEQMAVMHYLSQIDDVQIAFNVRQRKPTTLDEAVSATLELESYLQPKLSVSEVTKNHVETEEAVAAVSQDSTAVMMKQLLERMERMEAELTIRKKQETDMAPERGRRGQQQFRNQGGSQLGRRRVVTCWNCGQSGHFSRECRYQHQGNDKP